MGRHFEFWSMASAGQVAGVTLGRFVIGPIPGGVVIDYFEIITVSSITLDLFVAFAFGGTSDTTAAAMAAAKPGLSRGSRSVDGKPGFRIRNVANTLFLSRVAVGRFEATGPYFFLVSGDNVGSGVTEMNMSIYGRRFFDDADG